MKHTLFKGKQFRHTATILLVLLLTFTLSSTVACAANAPSNLTAFLADYCDVQVPKAAQTMLAASEKRTWTVGQAQFTLEESIADGNIAYLVTRVAPVGDKALLFANIAEGVNDVDDPIAYPNLLALYGCADGTTYLQLAQKLNLPLYAVSVDPMTVDPEECGDQMMDCVYQPDGSVVFINLLQFMGNALDLPLHFGMEFTQLDPQTGEELEKSNLQVVHTFSIPVQGTLGTRTFTAQDETISNGNAFVQSITFTQKVTGTYFTIHLKALRKPAGDEQPYDLYDFFKLVDDAGRELPSGISLSGSCDDSAINGMVSLDALPDRVNIAVMDPSKQTALSVTALTQYSDIAP